MRGNPPKPAQEGDGPLGPKAVVWRIDIGEAEVILHRNALGNGMPVENARFRGGKFFIVEDVEGMGFTVEVVGSGNFLKVWGAPSLAAEEGKGSKGGLEVGIVEPPEKAGDDLVFGAGFAVEGDHAFPPVSDKVVVDDGGNLFGIEKAEEVGIFGAEGMPGGGNPGGIDARVVPQGVQEACGLVGGEPLIGPALPDEGEGKGIAIQEAGGGFAKSGVVHGEGDKPGADIMESHGIGHPEGVLTGTGRAVEAGPRQLGLPGEVFLGAAGAGKAEDGGPR